VADCDADGRGLADAVGGDVGAVVGDAVAIAEGDGVGFGVGGEAPAQPTSTIKAIGNATRTLLWFMARP
jgi:hypothetical protein